MTHDDAFPSTFLFRVLWPLDSFLSCTLLLVCFSWCSFCELESGWVLCPPLPDVSFVLSVNDLFNEERRYLYFTRYRHVEYFYHVYRILLSFSSNRDPRKLELAASFCYLHWNSDSCLSFVHLFRTWIVLLAVSPKKQLSKLEMVMKDVIVVQIYLEWYAFESTFHHYETHFLLGQSRYIIRGASEL